MLTGDTQAKAANRAKRVAGQVDGIRRMIEDDRYCVDILVQIAAARAALDGLGKMVLGTHIETCVAEAFESNKRGERETKIAELLDVFARFGQVARQ